MNHLRLAVAITAMIALASTAGLAAVRPGILRSTTTENLHHSYSGTLQSRRNLVLTIRLRTRKLILVDATQAYLHNKVTEPLVIGESLLAQGDLIAGVLVATSAARTTSNALTWAPDR